MEPLSVEEKYIIKVLRENGGKLNYRKLQKLCEQEFEGVRLILKKMKGKGILDFDGDIPGFSADISLIQDVE